MAAQTGDDRVAGKYRLVRLLGEGGMASVYEAWHEHLGVPVAIKILHPHLARMGDRVERFAREARAAARIRSPHVVQAFDVDRTAEGLPFLVMEYVPGWTLGAVMMESQSRGQRFPPAEAVAWMLQICEGVEAAHQAGIVHRDLKPDNVLLHRASDGALVLQVMDFGIAKLKFEGGVTAPGVMIGTPQYMAPEQMHAPERVDERADVFSLGVILFELVAGRRPVEADTLWAISAHYAAGDIARLDSIVPGIDPQLAQAVHRALSASPEERFASVAAFCAAMEPFAARGEVGASAAGSAACPPNRAPVAITVDDAPVWQLAAGPTIPAAPLLASAPRSQSPARRRMSPMRLALLTVFLAVAGFLAGMLWYYFAHEHGPRRRRAPARKPRAAKPSPR